MKIPKVSVRVNEILEDVVSKIEQLTYAKKIILYGSYSKGNFTNESDIDLAIFIDDNSESIFNEYKKVAFICAEYCMDIQPQVFYECELLEPIGIVEEIVEYGIELNNKTK